MEEITPDNSYLNLTFDMPSICEPNDIILSLVYLKESDIIDQMFFKPFEKILITTLFPIILTLGIIGNVAFLTVVTLVKEMRTLTNFYLANLAVADLLYIVLQLIAPYTITYAFSGGLRLAGIFHTDIECGFFWSAIFTTYFTSLFLVTLVSLERFLAICYPLKHRRSNTQKRSIVLVILAWIIAVALASFIARSLGSVLRYCLIWPPGDRWQKFPNVIYFCYSSNQTLLDASLTAQISFFIVAFAVNTFLYGKIISRLSRRRVTKTKGGGGHPSANKIRNSVARMLIANGVIFFLLFGAFSISQFSLCCSKQYQRHCVGPNPITGSSMVRNIYPSSKLSH